MNVLSDSQQIGIDGKNFGDGTPIVTIDNIATTVMTSTSTQITVAMPNTMTAKSYRLAVHETTAAGVDTGRYDLFEFTYGAVGPQGPQGVAGQSFTLVTGSYGAAVCARNVVPVPGACPTNGVAVGIGSIKYGDATACQNDAAGDVSSVQVAPMCMVPK